MSSEQTWQQWLERLYNLRRDKSGSHERPHKPALLLAILDLVDKGRVTRNDIPLNEDLVKTFRRYFDVVRQHDDKPSIENPFYFLSRDGFWTLLRFLNLDLGPKFAWSTGLTGYPFYGSLRPWLPISKPCTSR